MSHPEQLLLPFGEVEFRNVTGLDVAAGPLPVEVVDGSEFGLERRSRVTRGRIAHLWTFGRLYGGVNGIRDASRDMEKRLL